MIMPEECTPRKNFNKYVAQHCKFDYFLKYVWGLKISKIGFLERWPLISWDLFFQILWTSQNVFTSLPYSLKCKYENQRSYMIYFNPLLLLTFACCCLFSQVSAIWKFEFIFTTMKLAAHYPFWQKMDALLKRQRKPQNCTRIYCICT